MSSSSSACSPLAILAFHLEAHYSGSADYATRAGIALVIVLITLIGGRIIPSFTRNWLAKRSEPGPMPAPFGRFDIADRCVKRHRACAVWVARPFDATTGVGMLLLCGCMHVVRLARWSWLPGHLRTVWC